MSNHLNPAQSEQSTVARKTSTGLALTLGAVISLWSWASVQAATIDPNIIISGASISYDTVSSFSDGDAAHSGTFSLTSGGSTSTSSFADGLLILGSNPLNGTLTDTGDGFGISGSASADRANTDSEFLAGVDLALTVTNNSVTDVFEVVFGVTFSQSIDATGTDAYVTSEFVVGDVTNNVEIFFSDITSDTVNGNEVDGNPVAGFGGPLSDSDSTTFSITLNPGESLDMDGFWTGEGGAYADATSFADLVGFTGSLTVVDVVNQTAVPVPGALYLFVSGLLGLVGMARRKKVA